MARVRAALLAAGRSVRMGTGAPKALAPLVDDRPIIHYTLAGLRNAGIDDLLVVTGFDPGSVESYVTEHWDGSPPLFVRNARWASWGNFHSARMALEQSPQSDVMLVNCDVVIHPSVLSDVASAPGDLVLAVQVRDRLDDEDMRVTLRGNRVLAIGKELPMDSSHGEFSGVSLLREEASRRYLAISTDLEWEARTSLYYEDVFALMLDGLDVRAVPVGEGEYAEVDYPQDLEGAGEVVRRHADAWERPAAQEPAGTGP